MVDIERIKTEIEDLRTLTAEEYCKEQVALIYADFEASKEAKIAKLESALEIFDKYQVEEAAEEAEEVCEDEYAENVNY